MIFLSAIKIKRYVNASSNKNICRIIFSSRLFQDLFKYCIVANFFFGDIINHISIWLDVFQISMCENAMVTANRVSRVALEKSRSQV